MSRRPLVSRRPGLEAPITMSADLPILERPVDVPARRWPKVLAFGVGFAAAIGAYLVARPRLSTWRSWATAHLASVASSSAGPTVAATAPTRASSADAPLGEQKASEDAMQAAIPATRRHRPRHRQASKR
jgi:hypothetical protein